MNFSAWFVPPPFLDQRALLASAGNTPKQKTAPSDSLDSITFSCPTIESKIINAERKSTDPNASTIAQMIRSVFLNRNHTRGAYICQHCTVQIV